MENNNEKQLKVSAIKNGTVLDHIPSGQVFKVIDILGLYDSPHPVTFGVNLDSKSMGSKGIIKISERFFKDDELNKIALVAPNASVNIIRDFEVVEKTSSVGVVPFNGNWKDLGTWNSLTEEMPDRTIGNAVMGEGSDGTHVVNELEIPIVCLGMKNAIVAASPDGILVGDKDSCTRLKSYATRFAKRPMYEERRWGTYKVMGYNVGRCHTHQGGTEARRAGCHRLADHRGADGQRTCRGRHCAARLGVARKRVKRPRRKDLRPDPKNGFAITVNIKLWNNPNSTNTTSRNIPPCTRPSTS